ncbi:3-methylornithine--L-lysine ligase PylC [Methanolobus sp. ZRKC3]|uniref:3-methylornithine--L-lysine ligase PylC n=1 Tax=Methanolobus sp. ZRKC3 TaxID=3125786 RepID=UPI00324333CC
MRSIALIGGKLQGFEANYLAKKAGMQVLLIDRNPQALSRNVVDEFHCFDITVEPEKLIAISKRVSGILPVNENLATLDFLRNIQDELGCPLLFDFDAYHISMDKNRSKEYFNSIQIPTPLDRPSSPPYFIKPPCESSSTGTAIIYDDAGLKGLDPSTLIEEYVEGDVVSLEVIGDGRHFAVIKETKVHVDDGYDCHMVTPMDNYPQFRDISYKLAKNLNLHGIMDVEAIDSEKGLKVLEIDARFPSQTPTAVYHSSGMNLLEMLLEAFLEGVQEENRHPDNRYCIFEHLAAMDDGLVGVGEHVLSDGNDYRQFHISEGLEIFHCTGGEHEVFTLISWDGTKAETEKKRENGLEMITNHFLKKEQGE